MRGRPGRLIKVDVFWRRGYELHVIGNVIKIRGMQEPGFLHPNIDKSRLHARQYPRNFSLVNIARNAHLFLAFNKEFCEEAVFRNRNAAFLRRGVDENFLLHKNRVNWRKYRVEIEGWRNLDRPAISVIRKRSLRQP